MIQSFHNIKPISGALVAFVGLIFATIGICSLIFLNPDFAVSGGYLSITLGTLSIILQSLYFNKICVEYDIVYTHTFIPALFYVMIGCSNYYFIQLGLPHISAWLFLFALNRIVAIPISSNPRRNIYSAAILFGIISLFIPFYFAATLLLILFILIFKTPTFLDILAVILGFLLPLIIVGSINLIAGTDLNYYLIRSIDFQTSPPLLGSQSNILLIPLILSFFGVFRAIFGYFKNNIQTRRMLIIVTYIFWFHVIIVLLNLSSFYQLITLLATPLCISFTYLHLGEKRVKLKSLSALVLMFSFLAHLVWQIMGL